MSTSVQRDVKSPYFSPRRKRPRSRSTSPCEGRGKSSRPAFRPDILPGSDSDATIDEQLAGQDPLYCFYFRTFTLLYKRLEQSKPLLIQGTSLHSAISWSVRCTTTTERVADDPWKVLVAVTLLNKTSGKLAIPVFWDILGRYPDPLTLSEAPFETLQSLLQPLGLHTIRARRLADLSKLYIDDPPSPTTLRQSRPYVQSMPISASSPPQPSSSQPAPSSPPAVSPRRKTQRDRYVPTSISHLPGAGAYALDSYRIFCMPPDEWKQVMPSDKELIKYLKWKWAFEERMKWVPGVGVDGRVDVEYLETLLGELES